MGLPSPGAFYALSRVDQDEALVHWQREQESCPTCHRPMSQCADPQAPRFPQRQVCFTKMDELAADAAYERMHADKPFHDGTFTSWAAKPSHEFPYHFKFGVTVFVAEVDLDPGDSFTTEEEAQPAALRLAASAEEG